jgi:Fe-S cluster assembly protein SufD
MAVYADLPEPNRAEHLWRYTPWHKIHPTGKVAEIPEATAGAVVSLTLLDGSEPPEGVSLSAATAEQIEKFRVAPEDDVASEFIRQLGSSEAVVLTIKANLRLEQPLLLEVEVEGKVCILHTILDIGRGCEAELVTKISGDADWFGMLREGKIADGANFNDVMLNQMGDGHCLRVDAMVIGRDAQVKAGTVGSGSTRCKSDLRFDMSNTGGNLSVNGSLLSAGKSHNDHHVEIMHEAPHTYSRLNWHSACGGKSRTVGTGMLRIANGAKGADASQKFHNLLLSKDAEADSIPELEVLEHEVVGCGHGTATGPIDEEQHFYLTTRGFSDDGARAVLISAFLNATLSAMGSNTLHDWLNEQLSGGLSSLAISGGALTLSDPVINDLD